MINNIRYIERQVAENYGDSINDLENTNYWELLNILSAKGDKDSPKQSNNKQTMNAYDFFKNHPI